MEVSQALLAWSHYTICDDELVCPNLSIFGIVAYPNLSIFGIMAYPNMSIFGIMACPNPFMFGILVQNCLYCGVLSLCIFEILACPCLPVA